MLYHVVSCYIILYHSITYCIIYIYTITGYNMYHMRIQRVSRPEKGWCRTPPPGPVAFVRPLDV